MIDSVILGWHKPLRKAFLEILTFYFPPPATVIDLCAGHKEFYKRIGKSGNTLDGRYRFIWGDRRALPSNDILCDIRAAPIKNESADVVVFDPPYGDAHYGHDQLERLYTTVNPEDAIKLMEAAYPEILRMLKPGGASFLKLETGTKTKSSIRCTA